MAENYGLMRAINELNSIFACQWSNGLLPQIRFVPGMGGYRPDAEDWGVSEAVSGQTRYRTSGITQPPIMGLCARRVYSRATEADQSSYLPDFLRMCDALDRYHGWLLRERDPLGENLAICLHPWETGTDNSPAFDPLILQTNAFIEQSGLNVDTFGRADTHHVDPAHRPTERDYYAYFGLMALFKKHGYEKAKIVAESPFLLQDVLFNTLFASSLAATADMQEELAASIELSGKAKDALRGLSITNRERADAVAGAIRRKLWHEGDGLFYSYDLRGGRPLLQPTVSSLMPLMGGVAADKQAARLIAHFDNVESFATPIPVPSTPLNSDAFNPRRYWSGPSWPVTNWLLIEGLRAHSRARAERLRAATLEMIAEGEPWEKVRAEAAAAMERNSYGDELTTPSGRQYAHGWLWDSAIVALSWPLVGGRPELAEVAPEKPGFWEYFEPFSGEPLGARPMTWTASLLLELLDHEV